MGENIEVITNYVHIARPAFAQEILQPRKAASSRSRGGNQNRRRIDALDYVVGIFRHSYQLVGVADPVLLQIRFVPNFIRKDATLVPSHDLSDIVAPIVHI